MSFSCVASLSVVGLVFALYVGDFRSSDDYMDGRGKKGIYGDLYYKRELTPSMGGGAASKVAKTSKTMTDIAIKTVSNHAKLHSKARCAKYPRGGPERFKVPDEYVSWDEDFSDYKPVVFTSDSVLAKPVWADPDLLKHEENKIQWNTVDGAVNRTSFTSKYKIEDGLPLNPRGRTGIRGRGCLGRWGPNHAADPIVTRWKRDENNEIVKDKNGKNILQFVSVKRRDNGQWALPGGMVDPNEKVTATLKREFGEEAMNSLMMTSEEEKSTMEKNINELFQHGVEIYKGYVDDPRNTDNSWMETVAYNFHDATGNAVAKFTLNAGDDAVGVKWTDLSGDIELYASHIDFLEKVAKNLNASWER